MRLLYVTSRYPFGPGEAFLGPEITAHARAGWDVWVFPAYPRGAVRHGDAAAMLERVVSPPGARVAADLARSVARDVSVRRALRTTLALPQSPRIRLKNLAVLSRLASLVGAIRRLEPDHVHVHWGGTSSTLAMAAARAAGVPWSMTLHRWDIYAGNLLGEKVGSAAFTRVISASAADEVRALVPGSEPHVVHMGVDVPGREPRVARASGPCRLVCVASLIPVKNHQGLLAAFASAAGAADATLELVGQGPLEQELRALTAELGIADRVTFAGLVEHDRLLARLRGGEWDGIVLASRGDATEHEGIPVSLMEAMAAGLPALATDSGATRDLVTDGAGLLVPPGDTEALRDALQRFTADEQLRSQLADAAFERVSADFSVDRVGEALRGLMAAGRG